MTLNKKKLVSEPLVEFSPGKDPYIKARKKGPSWFNNIKIFFYQ